MKIKMSFCFVLILVCLLSMTSILYAQPEPSDTIVTLDWSHDGKKVAGGRSDGTISIWEANSQVSIVSLPAHESVVVDLEWNPIDERLVSVSMDGTIKVWDTLNGKLLQTINYGRLYTVISSVTWNIDGTQIVTTSVEEALNLAVWDVATGQRISEGAQNVGPIIDFEWKPDSELVLVANAAGSVEMFAGENLQLLQSYSTGSAVYAIAWQQQGRYFASGQLDGTVQVWDIESDRVVHTFRAANSEANDVYVTAVRGLSFTADGTELMSVTSDGTVQKWNISTGESVETISTGFFVRAARWSAYGGRLALASTDIHSQLDLLDVTSETQSGSDLILLYPFISLEQLEDVVSLCLQQPDAFTNSLTLENLPQFIEQVSALSEPACATEIAGVAETLISAPSYRKSSINISR